MLDWLKENLGTILVSLVLLAAVAAILFRLRRNKKRGVSSCGCSCGNCPMSGTCHRQK